MNVYTDIHVITQFSEQAIQVTTDNGTVTLDKGNHRVNLTLTAAQFAEVAEACKTAAESIKSERAA